MDDYFDEDFDILRQALESIAFEPDDHDIRCDIDWGSCSCEKAPWDALARIEDELDRLRRLQPE